MPCRSMFLLRFIVHMSICGRPTMDGLTSRKLFETSVSEGLCCSNTRYALPQTYRADRCWHCSCPEEGQSRGMNSEELRGEDTPHVQPMVACQFASFQGSRISLDLVIRL